jgi:hypothetical protein
MIEQVVIAFVSRYLGAGSVTMPNRSMPAPLMSAMVLTTSP